MKARKYEESTTMTTVVGPDVANRIAEYCWDNRVTVSSAIRTILEEWYKRESEDTQLNHGMTDEEIEAKIASGELTPVEYEVGLK